MREARVLADKAMRRNIDEFEIRRMFQLAHVRLKPPRYPKVVGNTVYASLLTVLDFYCLSYP